jgi:hypothetical protein
MQYLYKVYITKNCHQSFVEEYPVSRVSCKRTIYSTVEKFQMTGSVLVKNEIRKYHTLTAEKLSDIDASTEMNPKQSLHGLSGVSKSPVQRATNLLKSSPL